MKKFFTLLFGIIMGIVLVFGGVAGAAVWFVTKDDGMGMVDDWISAFSFSDDIRNMNILDYVKNIQKTLSNYQTSTLGEIEDAIGIPITEKIASMLGIDKEVLRKSNFEKLPTAIIDSFTIETLEQKFGVKLPDMPMFNSPDFRTKPLMEAFNSLSTMLDPQKMTVADLELNFGIKLSDNPLFKDPAIANAVVGNLGEALNEVQLAAMLGVVYQSDVTKFNETHLATEESLTLWKSDKVPYAEHLASGGLTPFDYFDTEVEQAAYIKEYNAKDPAPTLKLVEQWEHLRKEEQNAIYKVLYPDPIVPPVDPDVPVDPPLPANPPDGYEFAKPVAPKVLTEGQTAPKESSSLIKKLSVNKIGDMTATGGSDEVISKIINNSTLGEIIEINPADTILYSLKDSKISTLDQDIKNISLNKIMTVDENSSAAMKFLVDVPLRDELEPWKKNDVSGEYETDAKGKRIPNYQQAKDADDNLIFDEDGATPVYVYATINTLDGKIKQMVIGDILPESENPNVILSKIKYSNLDNLEIDLNAAMENTTIGELVKTPEGETPSSVLQALSDKKISELNQAMNDLTIADVIPEKDGEHIIITKLRNKGTKVTELGVALNEVVNDTTLGELIATDADSSSILLALSGTKISEIDTKIKTLTLNEMFGEDALYEKTGDVIDKTKPKGVLGLIDFKNRDGDGNGTTTIANIGENSTKAIKEGTLAELRLVGLLPEDESVTSNAVDMIIAKDIANDTTTTIFSLPGAIIDVMLNSTIGTLVDNGLLTIAGSGAQLEALKRLTLQQILNSIADGTISIIPQIPLP